VPRPVSSTLELSEDVNLRNWYAYHSQKTMKHSYASVGKSGMYLTREHSALCRGDIVWVVEGDLSNPTNYSLVDCFSYEEASYPPFSPEYSRFKIYIQGNKSFLRIPVSLDISVEWMTHLHGQYITKQKFFCPLHTEPKVQEGLSLVSGVKF
jgi:hypothetical protein